MKKKFYLMPQIGDGEFGNEFRPVFSDVVNLQQGESWIGYMHPAKRIILCFVKASDATHTSINAVANVIPISELYEEGNVNLDKKFNLIAGANTIKQKLEDNGINTNWIDGDSTLREALRYLMKLFRISQINYGEGQNDINYKVRDFLKTNIDTQVQDVSQDIKDSVNQWMQAKNLDVGWITGTTTVREVLHHIVNNLNAPVVKFGGEVF